MSPNRVLNKTLISMTDAQKRNVGSNQQTDVLTRCEQALEEISHGLNALEGCALEGLTGSRYIDIAARLNAQGQAIEKLMKPLKDGLKQEALKTSEGKPFDQATLRGNAYQAIIKKISKTVMDTDKIKAFLGRKLYQFQKDREEIQILFKIKE